MAYRFSPSTLSLLKECPKCFWLHFNGVKRPQGIFPSLPGGMDRILKEYYDKFLGKGVPPEIADLENVELFDDKEVLKRWRNNFRGIRHQDEKGNVLMGAVDNILKKDNKLIVLDYKTRGWPLKDDTHTYYQDQMDFYTFLLQKEGYETEDHAYLLFFHPDKVVDGKFLFHSELVKLGVDVGNAEKIFKKGIEVLESDCPEPSEGCEFCEWWKKYSFSAKTE